MPKGDKAHHLSTAESLSDGKKASEGFGWGIRRVGVTNAMLPWNPGPAWGVESVKKIPQSTGKNLKPSLLLLIAEIENITTWTTEIQDCSEMLNKFKFRLFKEVCRHVTRGKQVCLSQRWLQSIYIRNPSQKVPRLCSWTSCVRVQEGLPALSQLMSCEGYTAVAVAPAPFSLQLSVNRSVSIVN